MQRLALRWRKAGVRVGFVPTMGYLHAGHLSLLERARKLVGPDGVVVASIYVNPTQFSPTEDLSKYPRDLKRDLKLCREAGVDFVFTPNDKSMYPGKAKGEYSTYVAEELLSQGMEGVSRPTHFKGVTTVVAKLFNLVLPDVAVFGAKDFQQAAVIQRMVKDLNIPTRVVVAPTKREPDGLAMSSRNVFLTRTQRSQALALTYAIQLSRKAVRAKRSLPVVALKAAVTGYFSTYPEAQLDYVEFFDPETLAPAAMVKRGTRMALAVFYGRTRLIDNDVL